MLSIYVHKLKFLYSNAEVKVKNYPGCISQESRKAIKEKKRPGTSSQYVRSPINYSKYLEARNKTTAAIQKAQKQQEYSIAANIKERAKLFWQHM